MEQGKFITFEGIDGCGKSTQVKMFFDYLFSKSKYNHVLMTREPYKDVNIREILQSDSDPYSKAQLLANLFVNDRRRHQEEVILPNLEKGIDVVSDRFSFSTLAYQQTQGVSLSDLLKMHKGIRIPDMIYLIDVPVDTAFSRMGSDKGRKTEQKFEKQKEFVEKLRQNYLKLKNLPNHNVVVINGAQSPEAVFKDVVKAYENRFG